MLAVDASELSNQALAFFLSHLGVRTLRRTTRAPESGLNDARTILNLAEWLARLGKHKQEESLGPVMGQQHIEHLCIRAACY